MRQAFNFFLFIFILILYRDTTFGDTSIDIGIDLTPLQSIVYRLTPFLSIVYRYRLTQKQSIAPISVDT